MNTTPGTNRGSKTSEQIGKIDGNYIKNSLNPLMVSGVGQYHTNEPNPKNPIEEQQGNYPHDDAQIVVGERSGSQGSPLSLTGPGGVTGGSPIGHQDKNEDQEKESKLAGVIASALIDTLCYDEIGGDWYSQQSGLWKVISEKKALKIIMKELDKKQPCGYSISKLNNVKSFLMLYLLLDKWVSNRHLLPMANGVLDTKTMQLGDYNHKHRFNWQLPYAFYLDAKIDVIKRWLWDASGHDWNLLISFVRSLKWHWWVVRFKSFLR